MDSSQTKTKDISKSERLTGCSVTSKFRISERKSEKKNLIRKEPQFNVADLLENVQVNSRDLDIMCLNYEVTKEANLKT